jgi:hypothetical protein
MTTIAKKLCGIACVFCLLLFFSSTSLAQNNNNMNDSTKTNQGYSNQNNHSYNNQNNQSSNNQSNSTNTKHKKLMSKAEQHSPMVRKRAIALRKDLNLNTKQTVKIENILQNYKNSSNQDTSAVFNKIDNLLTRNQKDKFQKVKTSWWNKTKQILASASTSNKSSNYMK